MTRAMERLTLTHATARSLYGRREYNPSHRGSSTSCRPRSSASGCGRVLVGVRAVAAPGRGARRSGDVPALSTGDSVRHGSLGEGVVTRIEPDGVVTVRFSADGSERRLMLDYAPLEKL